MELRPSLATALRSSKPGGLDRASPSDHAPDDEREHDDEKDYQNCVEHFTPFAMRRSLMPTRANRRAWRRGTTVFIGHWRALLGVRTVIPNLRPSPIVRMR